MGHFRSPEVGHFRSPLTLHTGSRRTARLEVESGPLSRPRSEPVTPRGVLQKCDFLKARQQDYPATGRQRSRPPIRMTPGRAFSSRYPPLPPSFQPGSTAPIFPRHRRSRGLPRGTTRNTTANKPPIICALEAMFDRHPRRSSKKDPDPPILATRSEPPGCGSTGPLVQCHCRSFGTVDLREPGVRREGGPKRRYPRDQTSYGTQTATAMD